MTSREHSRVVAGVDYEILFLYCLPLLLIPFILDLHCILHFRELLPLYVLIPSCRTLSAPSYLPRIYDMKMYSIQYMKNVLTFLHQFAASCLKRFLHLLHCLKGRKYITYCWIAESYLSLKWCMFQVIMDKL